MYTRVHIIPNIGPLPWEVQPGDIYEFRSNMYCRDGNVYHIGDRLFVRYRTLETPHGEIGEANRNWVCDTQYGSSVWATLEQCVSRGLFKKVDDRPWTDAAAVGHGPQGTPGRTTGGTRVKPRVYDFPNFFARQQQSPVKVQVEQVHPGGACKVYVTRTRRRTR